VIPERAVILLAAAVLLARAQTTQGMITGRIYDRMTGAPIDNVSIECLNLQTGEITPASTTDGYYTLLRLSPGTYWIRATVSPLSGGETYQPREAYELDLDVAARMQLDIPLRRSSDTYDQQALADSYLPNTDAIVRIYTADLDTIVSEPLSPLMGSSGTLLSTLSYVVDPQQVSNLPLAGRDIYTMLVTLPGVTADNATARGLGLSANGQRSYSANYLLDGVENNDRLLSGPLTVVAPEATEEYRVSTNNFSAEYGATSGLVANAVTRAGTNAWHGLAYEYLNNTVLDANSYQHIAGLSNSTGERGQQALPRQKETQTHTGFWVGGPLLRNRLFASAAFELFRSRSSSDPFPFQVPILSRFEALGANLESVALLKQFPPPIPTSFSASANPGALSTTYDARIPIQFNNELGLARVDYITGAQRILARLSLSRQDQPDFIYSIYPGFSSSLDVNSTSFAMAHLWAPRDNLNNELRFAYRDSSQGWNRPHPEIPQLSISTGQDNGVTYPLGIDLPGSPADNAFHYTDRDGEFSDVFTFARGPHVLTMGAGLQVNRSSALLAFQADGLYSFSNLQEFATDAPDSLQITVPRQGPQALPAYGVTPQYRHDLSTNQFYGFVEDSIKLTQSLGINIGLRYESFGAPRETGSAQDGYFQPGPGTNIETRIASGSMVYPSGPYSLYQPDRNNWAPRFGLYKDLFGRGRTVIRAAYGIFYDRPFDLLTLGTLYNNFVSVSISDVQGIYPLVTRTPPSGNAVPLSLEPLLWVDAHLRTPYAQSWFGGIEQHISRNLYFQTQAQGALGRHLISTDIVNRRAALSLGSPTLGRLNQSLADDIYYRSNQGTSSYAALTALARYRSRRGETQVAYTWGHSIDDQSDPLQGNFDDLQPTRASNTNTGDDRAGFTRQFQSGADRASSDFDQRQNLVLYSIWEVGVPSRHGFANSILNNWQVAGIAGFRSGFPFNVISTSLLPACPGSGGATSDTEILRNRPSLIPGRSPFLAHPIPVPGGYQLLDPSAFCDPGPTQVGNLGRNALVGPGFWNVDLSLVKAFHPRKLGDSGAIQIRADFFNAFNHANLGNPDGLAEICSGCTFGQAMLGRQGVQPSFPSQIPLDQLARQVQLQIKVLF